MCVVFFQRIPKRMVRKKKWSSIMDIEVQDLSQKDIFSSVGMRWSEVLKEDKSVDRVAIIPYSRVPDFIKGEQINLDAPCSFFRRRNIVKDDLDDRDFTSNKYSM